MKKCCVCKVEKLSTDFYKLSESKDGLDYRCKKCRRSSSSQSDISQTKKVRLQALEILGPVCAHCGFSDVRALQIDHVNGGGNQDRILSGSNYNIHKRIIAGDVIGFQVLCANCNWIKREENREFNLGEGSKSLISEPKALL